MIESSRVGNGNINILAPRNIDDACIGASVPGVPFDDTTVVVVLNGWWSPTGEVEMIIPALGIISKVEGATRMGWGEDQRLAGKDGHEEAVAWDSRHEKINERIIDRVVPMD